MGCSVGHVSFEDAYEAMGLATSMSNPNGA